MALQRKRPPSQRNNYMMLIIDAKREETKIKRLKIMVKELKAGNRYMNMKWSGSK